MVRGEPKMEVGMDEIIMPCGDNCAICPRFTAQTIEELQNAAELWYKAGFTDRIFTPEEIKCTGCSSHHYCTYGLIDCLKEHKIQKCNQCIEFPCDKTNDMLKRTEQYKKRCKEICSDMDFLILSKAFFEKEINLRK